jgi:hypothetical protein
MALSRASVRSPGIAVAVGVAMPLVYAPLAHHLFGTASLSPSD